MVKLPNVLAHRRYLKFEILLLLVLPFLVENFQAQTHRHAGDFRVSELSTLTITDQSPTALKYSRPQYLGSVSGRIRALATVDGRRLYAIASNTGLWRSSDSGQTWCQLTARIPCADGLPATAIPVSVLLDVAVAPAALPPTPNPVPDARALRTDSVVLVAAGYDTRVNSLAGIYRSVDGGATWSRRKTFTCGSVKPAFQVRFAPDDPKLAWASGGCGVFKSVDGGFSWPYDVSPVAGLDVAHIAVSERDANGAHWVYAWGRSPSVESQVYFSSNGGRSWSSVAPPRPAVGWYEYQGSPHVLATWPNQPNRLFFATREGGNGLRVFDSCVPSTLRCGDTVTVLPPSAPTNCPAVPWQVKCGGGLFWGDFSVGPTRPPAPVGRLIEQPALHGDRGRDWDHDSPPAPTAAASFSWSQVASPPTYIGTGSGSGSPFVITKAKPNGPGFFVFFGDLDTVHVHDGVPLPDIQQVSWHRLDGLDPWASPGNRSFMHFDPFDLLVSPDFDIDLRRPPCNRGPGPPCDTITTGSRGKIWIADDGGIYASTNLASAQGGWKPAARGLSTLFLLGAAVLARPGAGYAAIYTGTADNDEFYLNPDGGPDWIVPDQEGDTAPYYSDFLLPDRVVATDHCRSPLLGVFPNTLLVPGIGPLPPPYPDIFSGRCQARDQSVSYPVGVNVDLPSGNLPVVQKLPGELSVVDMVMIGNTSRTSEAPVLYRNLNNLEDERPISWMPVRPVNNFPATARVVQSSGGHTAPTYFVQTADGELYRGKSVGTYQVDDWTEIVPALGACKVRRFFVDPYDPRTIYIDDYFKNPNECSTPTMRGIKISTDGGSTWRPATSLQSVMTNTTATGPEFTTACNYGLQGGGDRDDGTPGPQGCFLNSMIFLPLERGTRFAMGITGVFVTVDGGSNWQRLFADTELPCTANAAGFDGVSTPGKRSLYVFCAGRGLLKVDGIPPPARLGPNPPNPVRAGN